MTDAAAQTLREHPEERKGILYAMTSYGIWGTVPVFWRALPEMSALAATVYRILWTVVFISLALALQGHLPRLLRSIKNRRTLVTLVVTSVLITANWTIYLYCVATNQLVETALGYYITPLISFALGLVFFGERISKLRWFCIGLASLALVLHIAYLGHLPWMAVSLGGSFALYGYFRKMADIAPLDGLLVETSVMFPFALAFAVWWQIAGTAPFLAGNVTSDILIVLTGPLTAIPLGLFAAGARLVRMTTLGFLQYLAPSITLLLAVFGFKEKFTEADFYSFALIWSALIIVALEGRGFAYIRAACSRLTASRAS